MNVCRPQNCRVMLLMMLIALVGSASRALAQKPVLSAENRTRIEACRQAILSCQFNDGAIPVVCFQQARRPAYVEPYLANIACLGLLSAHTYKANPKDLPYVERWLQWYADHQEPDGTMARYDGIRSVNGQLNADAKKLDPDSHDAYAATYLAVAEAYTRASGAKPNLNAKIVAACKKCLTVLDRCFDKQTGFYWNFDPANMPVKPDGTKVIRAQYLLDNTEVHQGLVAAADYFKETGDKNLAAKARTSANALAGRMSDFWYPEEGYFVCLYADKAAKVLWGRQPLAA